MKAVPVLLALLGAACNQAFGLSETALPPPDAPLACPALGAAPVYSPIFHQIAFQNCSGYSPSVTAGIALAGCLGTGTSGPTIALGPIDQPVQPIDVPPENSFVNLQSPRLVPEGDLAYVCENNFDANGSNKFSAYRPVDATSWAYVADLALPFPATYALGIGTPSRAPARHMMVFDDSGLGPSLHEVVQQDDGSWQELEPAYALDELGARVQTAPNLTPDGLRMVFNGVGQAATSQAVFYADRPSLDARFTHAVPLEGVPDVYDPYMTEDCSRVYFSGLGSILYIQEK